MKTNTQTCVGVTAIIVATIALLQLPASAQGFRKLEDFTVQAAKKDDKPQQESSAGWQKIVLDEKLFPKVWPNADMAYKVAIGLDVLRRGDAKDLLSIPLAQVEESKVTPEALQQKHGKAKIEVSENAGDKGVTYHIYGPLAFGLKSGSTYFTFLRAERRLFEEGFTTVAESSATVANPGTASAPLDSKPRNWPKYSEELRGGMEVRVKNPNEFKVRVGLRSEGNGRDFTVGPNATESVRVPNGRYDMYFQYSSDPDGLYQGDSFTLKDNGVEIQIVKVVNGNYGIRKVK